MRSTLMASPIFLEHIILSCSVNKMMMMIAGVECRWKHCVVARVEIM